LQDLAISEAFGALSCLYFRRDMGRLLRKKASSAKKKKKRKADAGASVQVQSLNDAGGVKTTSAEMQYQDDQTAKTVVPKKQSQVSRVVPAGSRASFINSSVQFLREVKIELKKVTWPSRKQTLGSTAVVIVVIVLISIFLGSVDIGLSSLIRAVLH
jgi:preprotein translocase subunit SecE